MSSNRDRCGRGDPGRRHRDRAVEEAATVRPSRGCPGDRGEGERAGEGHGLLAEGTGRSRHLRSRHGRRWARPRSADQLRGRGHLGVERLDLAGPAMQKQKDDGLVGDERGSGLRGCGPGA